MSIFLDPFYNAFLYFRLGNSPGTSTPKCLYVSDWKDPSKHLQRLGHIIDISALPSPRKGTTRVCVISDTHERHGCLNQIPRCDLLIHAGDILMSSRLVSASGAIRKYVDFNRWLGTLDADRIIVIGGNHDMHLESLLPEQLRTIFTNAMYLENSSCEVKPGFRVFGSPASKGHSGNRAFQSAEYRRAMMTAWQQTVGESTSLGMTTGVGDTVLTVDVDSCIKTVVVEEGEGEVGCVDNGSNRRESDSETSTDDVLPSTAAASASASTAGTASATGTGINDQQMAIASGDGGDDSSCQHSALLCSQDSAVSTENRNGVDIIVTHALHPKVMQSSSLPRVYVYGHYHAMYGAFYNSHEDVLYVCGSIMNGRYEPVNHPIIFDIIDT